MTIDLLPECLLERYQVIEWKHACAILKKDFPTEWVDIIEVLSEFQLKKSEVVVSGGRKSLISSAIDKAFYDRGWTEKQVKSEFIVDGEPLEVQTHKIDCYKNRVGLEIEWNSKDQTYDRDLNNFRLLFDVNQLSVGIIVTRSDELQEIFNSLGRDVAKKYGASTTHMGKLIPRLRGGRGGGCPILIFGITKKLYVEDITDSEALAEASIFEAEEGLALPGGGDDENIIGEDYE